MYHLAEININKIIGIYKVECADDYTVIHQNREALMIAVCLEGSFVIRQGRRNKKVDKNHVGIFPAQSKYRLCNVAGTKIVFIELELTDLNLKRPDIAEVVNDDKIIQIAMDIEQAWSKRLTNYYLTCMGGIYMILSDIAIDIEKRYRLARRIDIIEDSLRYMEEHFCDPDISNEKLAEIANISVVYFRKIFTSTFKYPPMKYIQDLRMSKAKELLGSGYYNVTEIAEMTGFSSIYSFSKTFKSVYGTSPNTFRSKRK